jgi:hypothetical protein
MDIVEVGLEGMDFIGLAQHRDRWRALVYTVLNILVSYCHLSECLTTGWTIERSRFDPRQGQRIFS